MKIEQTNKLRMVQSTLATLQTHQGEWQAIPGFVSAVTALAAAEETIQEMARTQTRCSGHAAAKAKAKQTMVNAAFTVCSGLKALASASEDARLAAQVDFSRSDLARGREADMLHRCQAMLDVGTANAEILAAKYNISANDLKTLKTALADFAETQPKPRQSRAEVAAATCELAQAFADADEVLGQQLDALMEKFQEANPAFYHEYQTARSIVGIPATHETKPPASTADQTTGSAPVSLPQAA